MATWDDLTKREQECYYYYGNGFSQVEIAHLFYISSETVRTHLHNGKNKLKGRTPQETLADLSRAGSIKKMTFDEKQTQLNLLKKLKEKYGKKKE